MDHTRGEYHILISVIDQRTQQCVEGSEEDKKTISLLSINAEVQFLKVHTIFHAYSDFLVGLNYRSSFFILSAQRSIPFSFC